MNADNSPEYLRLVQTAVADFRATFVAFLDLHVANDSFARGIAPAIFPKDSVTSAQIADATRRVALAAGRASRAPSMTNMFVMVQGAGAIDPVAAWASVAQPKPVLEPVVVLDACDQMYGRLEDLVARAEAEKPPTTGVEATHPLIWGAARGLWLSGYYQQAVAAAAEALVGQVKVRVGRNDVAETALWQEVFSDKPPQPGKARLRWPGDPADRNVQTMNAGLRQYAPGVQMTIRNPSAHTGGLTPQEALERLAALSLLAGWVDQCILEAE
ncbi:TIGR02391 family protein [Cellulomonas hominis]